MKDLGYVPERQRHRPRQRPHTHYLAALAVAGMALWLGSVTIAAIRPAQDMADPAAAAVVTTVEPVLPAVGETPASDPALALERNSNPGVEAATEPAAVHEFTVRSGDTLERIFRRVGVDPADAYLASRQEETRILNRLHPGKSLRLAVDADGRLQELLYEVDLATRLRVARSAEGDAFSVETKTREFETRLRYVSGVIDSSLFDAGQRAGLADPVIMQLVEIFGWDIDFVLDLRDSDSFAVVYEEDFWRGHKVANGTVVAAEFINRGNRVRAVRHVDADGHAHYYSPDGENMRKAFLRTPVEFSRISSRFGRRHHPVLNRMRMHNGVDYAAPAGTPVRATADGRIVHRGRKGGYGNAVVIRHGGSYSTLYAHLSRFKSGLRNGDRVRQGDVIGYIGSTGLATGPHLHYEFRVNGAHANPLNFKQPKAEPIPAKYRSAFLQQAGVWETRLDLVARREDVKVAAAQ